jgi:hypothetical protein
MQAVRVKQVLAETVSGKVYAATARFGFAVPDIAFLLLHEYALRSQGKTARFAFVASRESPVDAAYWKYSDMLSGFYGQLLSASPLERRQYFDKLLEFTRTRRVISGLVGPLLSAMVDASAAGDSDRVAEIVAVFEPQPGEARRDAADDVCILDASHRHVHFLSTSDLGTYIAAISELLGYGRRIRQQSAILQEAALKRNIDVTRGSLNPPSAAGPLSSRGSPSVTGGGLEGNGGRNAGPGTSIGPRGNAGGGLGGLSGDPLDQGPFGGTLHGPGSVGSRGSGSGGLGGLGGSPIGGDDPFGGGFDPNEGGGFGRGPLEGYSLESILEAGGGRGLGGGFGGGQGGRPRPGFGSGSGGPRMAGADGATAQDYALCIAMVSAGIAGIAGGMGKASGGAAGSAQGIGTSGGMAGMICLGAGALGTWAGTGDGLELGPEAAPGAGGQTGNQGTSQSGTVPTSSGGGSTGTTTGGSGGSTGSQGTSQPGTTPASSSGGGSTGTTSSSGTGGSTGTQGTSQPGATTTTSGGGSSGGSTSGSGGSTGTQGTSEPGKAPSNSGSMANPDDTSAPVSFTNLETIVGKGLAATIAKKGGCYAITSVPQTLLDSLFGLTFAGQSAIINARINPNPEGESGTSSQSASPALLRQRINRLIDPTLEHS